MRDDQGMIVGDDDFRATGDLESDDPCSLFNLYCWAAAGGLFAHLLCLCTAWTQDPG